MPGRTGFGDNRAVATTETYLAIDLGAGSGRVIAGRFDGERIELDEIRRFANPGVRVLDSLHWDVLRLFDEMKAGVAAAREEKPISLGVDTWGVDFALLDRTGALVGSPYHYRDRRTDGRMAAAFEIVPREEIFEQTGLQFMEINSLYQLFSMKGTPALEAADRLLMMPDLFHYWFTGVKACEFTDASTTQFHNPRKKGWATDLLDRLGLSSKILGDIVAPGTKLGPLRTSVADELGLTGVSVVTPATHDTASAVAAVPVSASGGEWAYLSSGTWSLLGVETAEPKVTAAALEKNFTNEGGVGGTTRLLKNICGMWILEECRREWRRAGAEVSYGELLAEAKAAAPFRSLIDVDLPELGAPGDMPRRLTAYCERTGQPKPETPGQFARMIFESLALKYRVVLDDLAEITGVRARTLHIVGGGSRNELLSQWAADACQVEVVAGPVEATAAGNVLLQAMALGRIANLAELREVVRRSFEPKRYQPSSGENWASAAARLAAMKAE